MPNKTFKRKNMKSKNKKTLKRSNSRNKKMRSNIRKLKGGGGTFKFIVLDNDIIKIKNDQLGEIEQLLTKSKATQNYNSQGEPKEFYYSHVLFYLNEEGKIIGDIYGSINNELSTVYIHSVKIRNTFTKLGKGTELLTEYINQILSKYSLVKAFILLNAGGIPSCKLYIKVFKNLGFTLYNEHNININLTCTNTDPEDIKELDYFITMIFKKIPTI